MKKIKAFLFKNTTNRQTIAKNTIWLISGEIISRLIRFCLIIYAARVLGTDGWGVFSYALSVVGLFMAFSDFGLSPLLTREHLSHNTTKQVTLSGAFYIKITLLILSLIVTFIAGEFVNTIPAARMIIPIAALILASDSLREFVIAVIRAQEKMEKEAFFRILTNSIIGIIGLALLIIAPSPFNLALAYLSGSVIGTIVVCYSVKNEITSFLVRVPIKSLLPILSFIWPIAILGVSSTVMASIDSVMLSWWHGVHDLGLYAADQRIVQFIYIIPTFFISALYPTLTRLYNENEEQFKKVFEQSLVMIIGVGLPIAIGGAILGKQILLLIFGAPYQEGSTAFMFLIASIICIFPNSLFYNASIIMNVHKKIAHLTWYGVLVCIVSNFVLIPMYSINGAAMGIFISQLFIMFFTWRKMKQYFSFTIGPKLIKIFIASGILGIIFLILGSFFHLVILIIIGVLIYIGILILFKEPILTEIQSMILPHRNN